MRHNNRRSLFQIPSSLINKKTIDAIEKIASSADTTLIKADVYKGKKIIKGKEIQEVRDVLKEIFYHKCAYCENIEHKPEIEHYRPKKEVKEAPNHPGYYWLCYEWSNLLPACHNCNTELGKRSQFPILGLRVVKPSFTSNGKLDQAKCQLTKSPLIDEHPLLLHPEIDFPEMEPYFKFYNNGNMQGLDIENRGQRTIEICDLNRANLCELRQEIVIDSLVDVINYGLEAYFEENDIGGKELQSFLTKVFEKLVEKQNPNRRFSLMHIYVYNHFDEIIIPLLKTPVQREAISNAFKWFKKSYSESHSK